MLEHMLVLRDTKTERYHPGLFRERPFPGTQPKHVQRLQSQSHHTEGFETLSAETDAMLALCEERGFTPHEEVQDFDGSTSGVIVLVEAACPSPLSLKRSRSMAHRMCSLCGTSYLDDDDGSTGVGPYAKTDRDRHTINDCLTLCEQELRRASSARVSALRDVEKARDRIREASRAAG